MLHIMNSTHKPDLRSWVDSANLVGCDFPIQNLPFARFRRTASDEEFRIGVAIGDQILDLKKTGLVDTDDMNTLMAQTSADRSALRAAISAGLASGSANKEAWSKALLNQECAEFTVPCRVGNYTDFYTSVHHATTVGKQFRPDNPLLPNYKWVPIGYHGRASSIVVSGMSVRRPRGQTKSPEAEVPTMGPSKRLDYELELGWFIGPGNPLGSAIEISDAEQNLFGVTLLNDWSARDIQGWEYQPLGPFLSKNFGTTVSPWVVTLEALAPFRVPFERAAGDPPPLPYLDSPGNRAHGAFSIVIEVFLQTAQMQRDEQAPVRLSSTDVARAAYWTPAQLIAHHTVNGCNLLPGDLLGSGTLSGPSTSEAGSLMELTNGGRNPLALPNGERRAFLEDGDTLILKGYCEREGAVRIGLGQATGTVRAS
jgi:fumarylacetoacetase